MKTGFERLIDYIRTWMPELDRIETSVLAHKVYSRCTENELNSKYGISQKAKDLIYSLV